MIENPAIVVVTYNRPNSLKRLLASIDNAYYLDRNIDLIISVDYQNSDSHTEVLSIADSFTWNYGRKSIIDHNKNLGLRAHVLKCGDLTDKYGSIIMLEDDLVVSPYFYSYATQALDFYSGDDSIGGVSLYNHKRNFNNGLPFDLIGEYNSDVYFLQIASSWGQAWTTKQWLTFRKWYNERPAITESDRMPASIIKWPESSWLKYFIKFLVETNRYFVYPKIAFSTNFGDTGTHNLKNNRNYQVPLCNSSEGTLNLINLVDSINVYDCYFEISSNILSRLTGKVVPQNCVIDLYGLKNLSSFSESHVISSKRLLQHSENTLAFGMNLKPLVCNIINGVEGKNFHLSKSEMFDGDISGLKIDYNNYDYFLGTISVVSLFKLVVSIVKRKLLLKLTNK